MKALVLYYSYTGNTEKIARQISETLNCDMAEIQPVKAYPGSYNATVNQSEKEIKNGYEPEIKPLKYDPQDYDTVILGFPVWWYTFAPPIKTALSSVNWEEKTVYAFATNAGWLGHSFPDVEKACQGADVKDGIDIRFSGKRLVTAQAEIDKWVARIGR
ncbi:MAG: flavodoxin [Lacrimispora sp.]|uniref:flavodoxin n=1 Tax=Lacrimispora sp. TaxID=2719234 RepID=UPI0039E42FBD